MASCLGDYTCSYLPDDGAVCPGGLCCNRVCVQDLVCCTAADCAPPLECQTSVSCTDNDCVYTNQPDGGSCGGGTCCSGECADLLDDRYNCGACGNQCYGGDLAASCVDGRCWAPVALGNTAGYWLLIDDNNVYWSEDGAILQAPKDQLLNPNPLTLDAWTPDYDPPQIMVDSGYVYYRTPRLNGRHDLKRVPIGGGAVEPLVFDCNMEYFAQDADYVYLPTWDCAGTAEHRLYRVDKITKVSTALANVYTTYLQVDADNVYFGSRWDGLWKVPITGGIPLQLTTEFENGIFQTVDDLYYFANGTGSWGCISNAYLHTVPKVGGSSTTVATSFNVGWYNRHVFYDS
ncbi:MAG: hypothetical protein KAI66_25040, partial [Lentisphaeria bacterium]|nr:hypothetical protein [Lentisphaeria bacterium]